jgi:hypothetical protein
VQLSRAVYDDDQTEPTCNGVMCNQTKRKDKMNITWRAV